MKAIVQDVVGGPEVLKVGEAPRPEPGRNELLVKVKAAALNRADTYQREGVYVPPPDQCQIMGIEIAGQVVEVGADTTGFEIGEAVFGIVNGGAYAEYCPIHAGMAIRKPKSLSFQEAAASPEVYCTAHETLFELGGLSQGQAVLIHAAGSGVGSACVQIAHDAGADVFCTAGSEAKLERARALGADVGINYKTSDFAEELLTVTEGRGLDLVEDFVGGAYLARNLRVLKPGGGLMLVGLLDGFSAELDLLQVVMKRIQLKGFSMRGRPMSEKVQITNRFVARWLPKLVEGTVKPLVHACFPFDQVGDAHRELEANRNFGKIILTL